MPLISVSQIARRTGLTVRTLHHYEAKGLLRPAQRSAAGYRLYGEAELRRLQHIVSLRALGFSLDEIGACLDADAVSLSEALTRQVDRLRATVERQHELLQRLQRLQNRLVRGETIDADTFVESIEASIMFEKFYTPEQLQQLEQRRAALGPDQIRAVEQEWPQLIDGMRTALALGKEPGDAEVQALARRWRTLVRAFSGGDAAIEAGAARLYREEPAAMQRETGMDPAVMAYAAKAVALLRD